MPIGRMVQVTLVSLDALIDGKHQYRIFAFDFKVIEPVLKALESLFKLVRAFWGIRAVVQVSVTPIKGEISALPSQDLIKKQGKIPIIPRSKGVICPGVSDRERYKTRHTVERFFAHIKEHKRLIARFNKLDATFFSFFALACLNVFKALCQQCHS